MICNDCLDGWHGRCLRRSLQGQPPCGCTICVLPSRAIPSAPKPRAATSRRPATKRARKPRQKAYVKVAPEADRRRQKLPRELKHGIAEALLAKADDWTHQACIRHGGHRAIAANCGVTYEQVRTVQRNLLELGRAAQEVTA